MEDQLALPEQPADNIDTFALTRYLYPKIEVNQSLMLALLDRNSDEALFWAYEMYFSGFQDDTFVFINVLYAYLYQTENPTIKTFIQTNYDNWTANQDQHWLLGSTVYTLSKLPYKIDQFIKNYYNIKCGGTLVSTKIIPKKRFIIRLRSSDIDKYNTVVLGDPTKVLKIATKYFIRKSTNQLFITYVPENMREIYNVHWLYYAARSPVWEKRIISFGGIACDDTKSVVFRSVDKEEDFYEQWGYDPDEQPTIVKEKSIGNGNETQLSVKDFCLKYGSPIQYKTIKLVRRAKP